jgi:hypothetical protein
VVEFIAVEVAVEGVEFVVVAEVVIPANDLLVVPVASGVRGVEVVVLDAGRSLAARVGGWQVAQDLFGDRADAALGNDVAGEGVAPVVGAIGATARFGGGVAAGVCGERVKDAHVVIRKVLAVAQVNGNGSDAGAGEGDDFLPAFETAEDEVLVLADGAAANAAKLVLLVVAFFGSSYVVAEIVGVEHRVAEVVVDIAVPVVRAAADDGVHDSARLVAVARIVDGSHGAELLDGVNAGGECPGTALIADGRSIQHENVVAIACAGAVEFVGIVDVPATGARKAAGAELFLCEDHPGSQVEQHVALAAVEGKFLYLDRVEDEAARSIARIDRFLFAYYSNFRADLTYGESKWQIQAGAYF